ncbi:HAD hydrolase-like protein [Polycladidibacter stylochi]|uniref:HAD hydrolase-like protein n=1 Tax=Polycladidibacter stylochi TaxID=1807766 RepID=UPI00083794FA|nr:HAD hydrolase-like protein [Pseudovibrio stylochi]
MQALLFDLDGTLTNPYIGITRSIQHALDKMGALQRDAEDLRFCIGPPLEESMAVLLETDDKKTIDKAVGFYRERYNEIGLFENEIYSGIAQLLAALKARDIKLFVCTSKPHIPARRIVEHFKISQYFYAVYGSEFDGTRSYKGDLIKYLLEQENLKANNCLMIGDRKHDLIAAAANNMRSIGVSWGFGSKQELKDFEPLTIVEDRASLLFVLDELMSETASTGGGLLG